MDISQNESSGTPIPARVARVVAPDRSQVSPKVINEMDDRDISVLRQIVRKEITVPEDLRTDRAISVLVDRDNSADTGLILSNVVADSSEKMKNRLCAATQLARVVPESAEPELIKRIDVEETTLKTQVIKSLGCIGGTAALTALDAVPDNLAPFAKKQLVFSKALISYRHNLDRDDLPFVEGAVRTPGEEDQLIDLSLRRLGKSSVEPLIPRLSGSNYGLELSDNLGFELDAGKAHWVLFMNKQLQDDGLFSSFTQRKFITGLLSLHEPRTDTYSPQYVVLSNPKGEEIEISVVRTDGEVFYTGKADLSGGILNFRMFDVDREGTAPTNVRGRLTPQGIQLDMSIPFGKRVNRKATVAENY